MWTEELFKESRNGITECIHHGTIAVVDEKGLLLSCGDPDWQCYYRSCSKPIQALPIFMYELDKKYGLSDEEAAMFSASHYGDPYHIRLLESIMKKTEIREEQLIINPVYPDREKEKIRLIRSGQPPKRLYHCCSGKHLGMLLLARQFNDAPEDYWKPDSHTQKNILNVLSRMADVETEKIDIGIDGCGVPVYAVPFHKIALSFLKLQCPELIQEDRLREAAVRNVNLLHKYPDTIAGSGIICSILTADPDILAKSGAAGVYALGIRSRRLGIAVKIMDGTHDLYGMAARGILMKLGLSSSVIEQTWKTYPDTISNSNGQIVGKREAVFELK